MYNLFFTKKYYSVNRADIAYLRCIIEAYEGLATLSTVDAKNGIISLSVPSCFADEAELLVQSLGSEVPITEIPYPDGCPGQGESPDKEEQIGNA